MRSSKQKSDNLRNFNLTVEEVKLEKAIQEIKISIARIQQATPSSDRPRFLKTQVVKLEEQLEELRESTLIR